MTKELPRFLLNLGSVCKALGLGVLVPVGLNVGTPLGSKPEPHWWVLVGVAVPFWAVFECWFLSSFRS